MRRKAATAVLLHREAFSMVDNWIDHVEVRRSRYGVLTVRGNEHGENPDTGRRCWGRWRRTPDLKNPVSLRSAVDAMAKSLGVSVDWAHAVPVLASIDWFTAAVIASTAGLRIPALPPADELVQQRSLRSLGPVVLGVTWGYEMHQLQISLEQWLRILSGEPWSTEEPYWYEGQRFTGRWAFDGRRGLQVTYDDGGVGWEGDLGGVDVIIGPQMDGVGLGRLALDAAGHS